MAINPTSNNVTDIAEKRFPSSLPVRPSKPVSAPKDLNKTPDVSKTTESIPSGKVLAFNKDLKASSSPRLGLGLFSTPSAAVSLRWLAAAKNPVEGDSRAKLVNDITKDLKLLGVC